MLGSLIVERQSLVVALVTAVLSGTLLPLVWGAFKSRKPEERRRADAREDERTAKAAHEAVDAVRDVLGEMRRAREDDAKQLAVQQTELETLRPLVQRVADLEKRVGELEAANGVG